MVTNLYFTSPSLFIVVVVVVVVMLFFLVFFFVCYLVDSTHPPRPGGCHVACVGALLTFITTVPGKTEQPSLLNLKKTKMSIVFLLYITSFGRIDKIKCYPLKIRRVCVFHVRSCINMRHSHSSPRHSRTLNGRKSQANLVAACHFHDR